MTGLRTPPAISPPKARPGDRVAVLSPAFAAPAVAPGIHEQGMRRLRELTGLEPVEYPTTRMLDASPEARAADVNAALADPGIRAILATIGGDDQITVTRHVDTALLAADPKPFLGFSDNTNLLNLWWGAGVRAFHGGSTQLHLGTGPGADPEHAASLRAALLDGGELELTEPGWSQDHGHEWDDPRALTDNRPDPRAPEPWSWAGPAALVSGPTWGGCLEIVDWLGLARRLPDPEALEGGILLVETSEERPDAATVGRWLRALGEGGILGAIAGVLAARPITRDRGEPDEAARRAAERAAQRDAIVETVARYNPDAVVATGVPFGHTRPQWIVPYGGILTLDGAERRVSASYD